MKRGYWALLLTATFGCSSIESPYASSTKIYIQQDNLEKALENVNKWIEETQSPKAYIWRGVIYTRKHEYTKAAKDFEKAFELDITYMSEEKFEKTVSIAGQPMLPYRSVPVIFNNAAVQLINEKNYDSALPYLELSLKLDSSNSNTYLLLSSVYDAKGNKKEAESYLRKAVDKDPKNYNAKLQLALYYSSEGKSEEAEKLLEDIVKNAESDTTGDEVDEKVKGEAYKEYAILMFEKKEYAEAIKYFQKALEIKEDDYEVLANLGNAYAAKKEYDSAIKYLKKAYSLKKDDHRIPQALAEIFYDMKDYENALMYINEAIELKGDDPNLYITRAAIYKAMGRKREALRDLKKAQTLKEGK